MRIPKEVQIRVLVAKKEESFLQSLLESHEGLTMILSTKRKGDEIEMLLSSSESFKGELLEVLQDLSSQIPLGFWEVEE
ncbi:MAG: DUF4911 domain-containing protein [Caldiserica bacterium]|jgi:hypothetical protein|nr:DUF4911 domain-containing protein [Caldisericota bacterium]MDH7561952.1 hypothetical protein [Caldisericota bacterium]